MEEIQKLTEICEPLVQYLKEHYDPHTTIVITMDEINLLRTEIHVPLSNMKIKATSIANKAGRRK